jgi:hypothetical protein
MTTITRSFTEEDTKRLAVAAEEIIEYKKFVTERFVRFLDLFYGIEIVERYDWDIPEQEDAHDWIEEYDLMEHTLYGDQHSTIIFIWKSKRPNLRVTEGMDIPDTVFGMPTVFLYKTEEQEADYINFLRTKKRLFG